MASFPGSIRSSSRISASLLIVLGIFLLALDTAAHGQKAHLSVAQVTLPIGGLTNPYGMAVDASGNVYVADNAENSLSKLTPSGSLSSGSSGATFLSGE